MAATHAQRSEATIQELVATARELFARRGFADTSIEDVVRAAGVTRGALYHHFDSKTDLFRAVFEEQEQRLTRDLERLSLSHEDAWRRMEAGADAFLEAASDPGVRQIMLIDAPAVLGWQEVREIQQGYGLALVRTGLEEAMKAGRLRRRPVEPLAHLMYGAMIEAAMVSARASDQRKSLTAARRGIHRLLEAIRAS